MYKYGMFLSLLILISACTPQSKSPDNALVRKNKLKKDIKRMVTSACKHQDKLTKKYSDFFNWVNATQQVYGTQASAELKPIILRKSNELKNEAWSSVWQDMYNKYPFLMVVRHLEEEMASLTTYRKYYEEHYKEIDSMVLEHVESNNELDVEFVKNWVNYTDFVTFFDHLEVTIRLLKIQDQYLNEASILIGSTDKI